MKLRFFTFIICFGLILPLSAATWVEDSLGVSFEFPRGWMKAVQRHPETAKIQFAKSNREAVLQIDAVKRTKDYDIDRFIEETVDTFLAKYPDLKVVREKNVENDVLGFDESVFLVMHYKEHKTLITTRFVFHRKGNIYYVLQAKTPRSQFTKYAKDLDLVMKSFKRESRPRNRWRNDSLGYLDPKKEEKIIQYISITIRPIETYKQDNPQKIRQEDNWLFSVEGHEPPKTGEWETNTNPETPPKEGSVTPEVGDEPLIPPSQSL
ncbi:hypothetical protein P3G55_06625 [Leptospira sp. 96542]|nr:hypothetical protein [Leptospira sp. 96542]